MAKNQESQKSTNKGWKLVAVSAAAGLLAGSIPFASVGAYNALSGNQSIVQSSNNVSSNTSGSAKLQNTSTGSSNNGSMTSAFNKVSAAVVSVSNLQPAKSSQNSLSSYFGQMYGDDEKAKSTLQTASEGSGLIYQTANGKGYIVTNNHVIEGATKLQVILNTGEAVDANVVGSDSVTDLAVLSIESAKVPATASFGSSDSLEPGQPVIAIGSPLGSQYATSVTQGIISAKSRTLNSNSGTQTTVIQTDAAINPGNSGGPLVNSDGQVVGINSMKLAQSQDGTNVEGMGFAIPSDEVVTIINQLVEKGSITRPKIGVRVASVSEMTQQLRQKVQLPDSVTGGVYIASVDDNTSAKEAGIQSGDVITKFEGHAVNSVTELHSLLYQKQVGDTISLEIVRAGQTQTVSLKLN
ncbi:S1C family serine protease [Holzapfeliella floricola]|uniref:PDZ domain-containing protein n=1 Tax=Holzapfeliella floricola DSM 23037 = JCM 16512 TaxID=1423744 RepID=A0A0R2DSQ9_9LACO|nr:trypsin-like peptidase domain-containing protein [Holzapfeliella floricola]KRN04853.1 hypothetical protein FC86_GL001212 [Holzapfeliella floricola DSM 23037 = JCM 16512]